MIIILSRRALEEAKIALSKNEVPVGAVIVADKKIIARAHNLTETLNDVTVAGDASNNKCIKLSRRKVRKGCTLYVTLEPCRIMGHFIGLKFLKIVFLEQKTYIEDTK